MKRWKAEVYLEDNEEFGSLKPEEINMAFDKAVGKIESMWRGLTVVDWDISEDE